MRIIGGVHGGRRLKAPSGDSTRPTSDRVREALFSLLEARFGTLEGLTVLDLYAGSGAIGLEAASRGARRVYAVESDRATASVVHDNAHSLGLATVGLAVSGGGTTVEVVTRSVARFLSDPAPLPAQVVFADPPYPLSEQALVADLTALVVHGWLDPDALVIIERSKRSPEPAWPPGLSPLPGKRRQKRYGETTLWLAQPTEAAAGSPTEPPSG